MPKAIEFYGDWLVFTIDWEHRFGENSPNYMQGSFGDVVLHLSEHHGDCSPGGRELIEDYKALPQYHQLLTAKDYTYNKPAIEKTFWDSNVHSMEVIAPFGNRLTFTGV